MPSATEVPLFSPELTLDLWHFCFLPLNAYYFHGLVQAKKHQRYIELEVVEICNLIQWQKRVLKMLNTKTETFCIFLEDLIVASPKFFQPKAKIENCSVNIVAK